MSNFMGFSIQDASQKLIDSVFSKDKQQRIQATEALINSYSNNTYVYKRIIEKAKADSNSDGVYNSTLILANANKQNVRNLQPKLHMLNSNSDKKALPNQRLHFKIK